MKRLLIVSLILLGISANLAYAEITVSGTVTDGDGEPLSALITIIADNAIEGYCNADERGRYAITCTPGSAESIEVKASLLGFTPVIKRVKAETQTVDFSMTEGGIMLKEVSVVADKIIQHGDTISFNVGAYRKESDRVIGDVIKKMPGLEVDDNGRISFNGKTVKNFYVEDMDLLEGRYGIATNNISANDVASVQVYQNHQPIKALQNWTPSEDVTINLRLKESARGTFSLNGMGGVGYKPVMWTSEAVAMYFGRKGQTITTYKGNNSGDNVSAEQNNLTGDSPMMFLKNAPLSVVSPGSPGVSGKRYIRNRSNTISTNNIVRLDSLSTVTFNVSYLDDILRKEGSSTTEQYMPDGDYRWISQVTKTKSYIHTLSGSSTYKKNTPSLYVVNSLNVSAGWNKDSGNNITTAGFMDATTDVTQHLDNPSFTVDDRVSIVLNSEKQAFDMSFGAGWNHRPQSLTVGPASIFGESDENDEIRQQYTSDNFKGEAQMSFRKRLGKVGFQSIAYGNVDIELASSQLHGFSEETLREASNDYTFGKAEVGFEPRLDYSVKELYLELSLPVGYNHQWLDDKLDSDRRRGWNYVNFSPQFKTTYKLGKSWWGLTASLYKIRDNSGRVAPGIVMTDYMSFREYLVDKTMVDKTLYSTIEYHYANAIAQLFCNASASWLRSSRNTMTGYEYDGLVTVRNVFDLPFTSNHYSATGSVNKGLGFWESTLKLGAAYSLNRSKQLINKSPVDYKAQYRSINLMMATIPAQWMGAALGVAYGENKSYTAVNRENAMTIRQCTGRLDLNFYPAPRLILNVAVEDNYTNMTSADRHTWFGDAKIVYRTGRIDWELELNNIFNCREFTRVNYTDMNIYRSTYELRPRNIMLKMRLKII